MQARSLSDLTGLELSIIESQILPQLDGMTPDQISEYLESFAGTSAQARTVIRQIVASRSHGGSRPITPSRLGPKPVDPIATTSKKRLTLTDDQVLAKMDPGKKKQAQRISRAIRLSALKADDPAVQKARCFCRGRLHPLSEYCRICPRCYLILCTLNSPSAPCPSCLFSPLQSSDDTQRIHQEQEALRQKILSQERDRLLMLMEAEAEEQSKVKFPSLPPASAQLPTKSQPSYSQARTHTVISLDLAKKKAYTSTPVPRKSKKKEAEPATLLALPVEEEEAGWIDVWDDGLREQMGERAPPLPRSSDLFKYIPASTEVQAIGENALDDD